MTGAELAYIAGFVDGDGCVWLGKQEGYEAGTVSVAQKDRQILDEIKELVGAGGSVYLASAKTGMHALGWGTAVSRELSRRLSPYLRLKRGKAIALGAQYAHREPWVVPEPDRSPEMFWPYLAGLVDSDGTIGIYDSITAGKVYPTPRFMIHQKDRRLLEQVQAEIGAGAICKRGKTADGEQMWYLTFGSAKSRELAQAVLPHLRVKRAEAEAVVAKTWKIRYDSVQDGERPDVQEAIYLYTVELLGIVEIGKIVRRVPETVLNWLHQHEIPIRSLAESQRLRRERETRLGIKRGVRPKEDPEVRRARMLARPEVQEAIRLTKEGLFAHEVAALIGHPTTTVKNWLKVTGEGMSKAEAGKLRFERQREKPLAILAHTEAKHG